MTRKEQEDQEQLEWLRKWKERRKGKIDVRKRSLFYKVLKIGRASCRERV